VYVLQDFRNRAVRNDYIPSTDLKFESRMFLAIQTIAGIHGIFTDENELTTFYSVKLIDNDGLSNENKIHVLCSHSILDSATNDPQAPNTT